MSCRGCFFFFIFLFVCLFLKNILKGCSEHRFVLLWSFTYMSLSGPSTLLWRGAVYKLDQRTRSHRRLASTLFYFRCTWHNLNIRGRWLKEHYLSHESHWMSYAKLVVFCFVINCASKPYFSVLCFSVPSHPILLKRNSAYLSWSPIKDLHHD